MVGIPGSGKSTYAKKNFPDAWYISRDEIRFDLVAENEEYLYSLDGTDPEEFGFAYDGPVLLDTTGDIKLRIKKLGNSQKKKVVCKRTRACCVLKQRAPAQNKCRR